MTGEKQPHMNIDKSLVKLIVTVLGIAVAIGIAWGMVTNQAENAVSKAERAELEIQKAVVIADAIQDKVAVVQLKAETAALKADINAVSIRVNRQESTAERKDLKSEIIRIDKTQAVLKSKVDKLSP